MRPLFTTLFSALLLLSIQASAQITIPTNNFQPAPGTQLISKSDDLADNVLFDDLMSGTGGPINWDFTDRTYTDESISEIVSAASTPQIGTFPDGNLVMRTTFVNDTSWTIFSSQPGHFWQLGEVSHSAADGEKIIAFQDSTPDYVFPIAYNNQWSSHRFWREGDDPDLYMENYDTTFYHVNAWGTITYGSKTIPVLRILSEERMTYVQVENGVPTTAFVMEMTTVSFVNSSFETAVSAWKNSSMFITQYGSSASAEFLDQQTDVEQDHENPLPRGFAMEQNYPNPFNPRTEIRFSLPNRADVSLKVYNLAGQEVKVLVDRSMPAGSFVADWDGTNQQNMPVASGVYFYRLEAGANSLTRKMVLLK